MPDLNEYRAEIDAIDTEITRLFEKRMNVVKKVTENGEKVEKTVYYTTTSGLVPMCVMGVSAVVMIVLGLLSKKVKKAAWLSDYALPISLLIGMASAIPFVALLGGEVTA